MKHRGSQVRAMERYPAKARMYNYALSFAAREGSDVAVVKAALAAGADPNWAAGMMSPPLHGTICHANTACPAGMKSRMKILSLLIAAKADLELRDAQGCTALYMAIDVGSREFCELLIDAGANPHDIDSDHRNIMQVIEHAGKGARPRFRDIEAMVQAKLPEMCLDAWVAENTPTQGVGL